MSQFHEEEIREHLRLGRRGDEGYVHMDYMTGLTSAAEHPVDWGAYRGELARLWEAHDEIGPLNRRRTPELLRRHAERANDVADAASHLDNAVTTAAAWRRRLVALFQGSNLVGEPAWLRRAIETHGEATRYGLSNWHSDSAVAHLADDARQLGARHRRWVPVHSGEFLSVHDLQTSVPHVEALIGDLGAFRQRVSTISARLSVVQEVDRRARQSGHVDSAASGDRGGQHGDPGTPGQPPRVSQAEWGGQLLSLHRPWWLRGHRRDSVLSSDLFRGGAAKSTFEAWLWGIRCSGTVGELFIGLPKLV